MLKGFKGLHEQLTFLCLEKQMVHKMESILCLLLTRSGNGPSEISWREPSQVAQVSSCQACHLQGSWSSHLTSSMEGLAWNVKWAANKMQSTETNPVNPVLIYSKKSTYMNLIHPVMGCPSWWIWMRVSLSREHPWRHKDVEKLWMKRKVVI